MSSIQSEIVEANPEWLIWARKTANYNIEEIAKKINVKVEKIEKWEETGKIAYKELIELDKSYRRPPIIFFNVNEPVYDEKSLPDFRTKESKIAEYTPAIGFEIRSALTRRENLLDIEELSDETTIPYFKFKDSNIKKSEEAISLIRKELKMNTANIQKRDLNYWIRAIENLGVLVFYFYDIPVKDMRGYSIYYDKLPIIGINNRDMETAKKFTLFHELSHLILKPEGISNLTNYFIENEKEKLSNEIAAELLVPKETLEFYFNNKVNEKEIADLSKMFKVSKEVIVRRFLTLNIISKEQYQEKRGIRQIYSYLERKKRF